jgi:hypothetical protein
MIPIGALAQLRFNGQKVGRVINFKLRIARGAVENTPLDLWDDTFVSGRRNSSGTGMVVYDPADGPTAALMNAVLLDSAATQGFELVFDRVLGKSMEFGAVLTQLEPGVAFGEAMIVPVSIQLSGKPVGTF